MAATQTTYTNLESIYHELNNWLFDGILPPVMITFQRSKRFKGYASKHRFERRYLVDGDPERVDEVALNPDLFREKDIDIVSTLLHEMAHIWQFHFGKQTRPAYHDKEWAAKMEEVGLTPSDTGLPGGKKTGQRVSHYITHGGAFETLYLQRFAGRIFLNYTSIPIDAQKAKKAEKTKYTCPICGANAWGRPNMRIVCNCEDCNSLMAEKTD